MSDVSTEQLNEAVYTGEAPSNVADVPAVEVAYDVSSDEQEVVVLREKKKPARPLKVTMTKDDLEAVIANAVNKALESKSKSVAEEDKEVRPSAIVNAHMPSVSRDASSFVAKEVAALKSRSDLPEVMQYGHQFFFETCLKHMNKFPRTITVLGD